MKQGTLAFILVISILFIQKGHASTNFQSTLGTAPIIDLNFDSSDQDFNARVQYPNGCFEPYTEVIGTEENQLILGHLAQIYLGFCTQAIEFRWVDFNISNLSNGVYTVVDAHEGKDLGTLVINEGGTFFK